MPLTASEIRDDERWPEVFEITKTGKLAERHWMANTDLFAEAISAAGLPRMDDPYDTIIYPDLKVVSLKPVWRTHQRAGDSTSTGQSVIRVRWETPGLRGRLQAEPGRKWTEFVPGAETINVKVTTDPDPRTIAGGDGVAKEVGVAELVVRTFHPPGYLPNIPQLLTLMDGTVNKFAITLPPMYGSSSSFTLAPGQARYKTFQPEWHPGEVLEVAHVLAIRRDWLATWEVEDNKGKVVRIDRGPIYVEADYGGIW